jgi:AcrR family transcriptional regulator
MVEELRAGSTSARGALLLAAAELFVDRGVSQVSLREVADRAKVNYGLIHHYFGTKEALLAELFSLLARYGLTFIETAPDAGAATAALFRVDSGRVAEMLAHIAIEATDPDAVFTDTSSLHAYSRLIEMQWRDANPIDWPEFDPRVVAGFVMLNVMVWDLYAPYIRVLSDLNDRELPDLRAEVLLLMQHLIQSSRPNPG